MGLSIVLVYIVEVSCLMSDESFDQVTSTFALITIPAVCVLWRCVYTTSVSCQDVCLNT